MILVGGFNTALDKLATTDTIEAGAVLRLRTVRTLPGGKGLHVALACATLGVPATLVGLIDDSSRTLFETTLSRAGAKFVGVKADECIRICYALRDPEGRTTELLEPGPSLTPAIAATLLDAFRREAAGAAVVVLSGSLPPGLPADTYATLDRGGRVGSSAPRLQRRGVGGRDGRRSDARQTKPAGGRADRGFPDRVHGRCRASRRGDRQPRSSLCGGVARRGGRRREDVRQGSSRSSPE